DIRLERAEVREDAPAEEPHHVPRVVEVHTRETGRHRQQQLVVPELQPHKEGHRGGKVAEGVHAAGEEGPGPWPDRGGHLAVDELARGAVNRRYHDPLAELDRDGRDDVEVDGRGRVRAEEPERENEEHPRDPEASQQRTGQDALDEERDERRARVDRRVELAEQILAPRPAARGKATVDTEGDEAHQEADRLRPDEVLGVDHRRDRGSDRTAEDLPDEDGTREEREEPLRLLRVVEVSRIHPEKDVDRLLDAV